ncbi:MAG TPA: R3H domain-containing nucleic acid-binding protein [Caldisericia bacterium]|nr:R3H domain-containing nucleic acid-binding protein [Caldisericia bacterium]HPF48648.1 R3H domain-containing nucleic acid-binding protein [Caldisericia bacterium]HPI83692.1 R3H domain-containing nucleic acid-binding protein [Caldisericia bacterium]HPQ93103.1 R3H domain-containing nucleic acid-binding protein [Caldisericia bacterium]HRV75064.1 R3H domain-containing nucleic acid-binding protein [Caldisericia bacterium]
MNEDYELNAFLGVMPDKVRECLVAEGNLERLYEVVLDLGRVPEARYSDKTVFLGDAPITFFDLEWVLSRIGNFDRDNRSGIERTLHRISGIMNRNNRVVGLTCRYGRAIEGVIDPVKDLFRKEDSVLLLGKPGVGKTTLLREAARILANEMDKRVVVVDTSNEIAGDGDIPHPGIGRARRMQVPIGVAQHKIMIQAVENHMPEVIIIDEIGTEEEAAACRTIAERGVQLIGTAHGQSLPNLLMNPTLSDLLGGVNSVILSDEEAFRRGTQKTVLERTAPPTFDTLIEIVDRGRFAIFEDLANTVDEYLRFDRLNPETRIKHKNGKVETITVTETEPTPEFRSAPAVAGIETDEDKIPSASKIGIYPFGVSRDYINRAIRTVRVYAEVKSRISEADLVLTTHAYEKKRPKTILQARTLEIPVYTIPKNTLTHVKRFVRGIDRGKPEVEADQSALDEAIELVLKENRSVRLKPAPSNIRRFQHKFAERFGLVTSSIGQEPDRSVVIHPPDFVEEEEEEDLNEEI